MKKCIYIWKNGNPEFSDKAFSVKEFNSNQEIKVNDEIFDFTLTNGQDYTPIINQFLEIKENLREKDPHAKIKILDRAIIINSNGNQSAYLIIGDKILPATLKEPEKINFAQKENENTSFIKYKEPSVFSKIISRIKQGFSKNKSGNIDYTTIKNPNQPNNDFYERIRDMDNFSPVSNNIPNTQNKGKYIEIDK